MLGLRNLYRVFHESRAAARKQASLSVSGDLPEAGELAALLGASRTTRGAEVLLAVTEARGGGVEVSLSGGAVQGTGEPVFLPTVTEEAVRKELACRVVRSLREEYLIPLGRGYSVFRRAVCGEIIRKNARQNAVIGFLPIPGADMPAITANQARMVLNIAAAHGEELSMERARELLGVLAAGFGFRALTRQILKLVPVAGWAASGAVGYAGTLAMGRTAILYFERGKEEPTPEEAAGIRRWAIKEAKAFVSRVRRR